MQFADALPCYAYQYWDSNVTSAGCLRSLRRPLRGIVRLAEVYNRVKASERAMFTFEVDALAPLRKVKSAQDLTDFR